MSRGKLDKETSRKVEESLPSVQDVRNKTLDLRPEFISMGFPPQSKIPIAAVCLQDATYSLQEVRYALFEALAHIVWYREKSEILNKHHAIFFGKFYADDAALRMFAVKEHLTNAIVNMLELGKQDLTRIGKDLKNKSPNHPLVNPIFKLIDSKDWNKTRKYRNHLVHNKPHMIKGLGINYERKNRLIVKPNSIGITVGQGDEAELSVNELLEYVKPSFFLLVETTTEIVEYYIDFLNKNQKTEW